MTRQYTSPKRKRGSAMWIDAIEINDTETAAKKFSAPIPGLELRI